MSASGPVERPLRSASGTVPSTRDFNPGQINSAQMPLISPVCRSHRLVQRALLLFFALLPLLSAHAAAKPKILASIAPLASWAINVAGDDADVECLLPSDVGPHEFQFGPKDLRRIRAADLIVQNGLDIETWLDRAIQQNRKLSSKIVVLTTGMEPQLIRGLTELKLPSASSSGKKSRTGTQHDHSHGDHSHGHGDANPHVWLDPILAAHSVSNLIAALEHADPAHASNYRRRGKEYVARLHALDAEYSASLKPIRSGKLITFHDAFPYLARRYELNLIGVIEEVPSVEPSPKYLAALIDVIRQNSVRVIFSEPQFNPRLAKQIAEDLKIRVAALDVLETGKPTSTSYEEGMRRNLAILIANL